MRWLRSFFNLRIRLILLVLLALLPALGIMLYTAAETRQREAEQIEAEALTLAQVISADQESLIVGARQLLIALSQIRDVQSGDPVLCSSRLVELLKLYPNYTGFGVAQLDGEVFCSTAPSAQPINASEQAWFQRSVESGDFSVGDYQVDRTTGRSILVFGYPVFNPADQLEKVMFAVIEPSILSQLATETSLPEGAVLTQVDRNGTVINRFPDPETWVGQTLPNTPLIQIILSRGEGVAQLAGLDGVSRLYAFTPLRSPLETGLYLSIGIPNQVAYARADQALRRNLIWLGLVGLLALLAAWFGGEAFILRRVKALVSATERVRQGDLGARTGLRYSRDELGYLARAFDDMATTLEQHETERQEAEETIREQRELLRVTLASIGDAVITTDTQARITFMNPVAETLSGWNQVEA
ncbi:MAG TPA: cache domain-containing protein, partial [Anaerolineae bacterium]|nr:cache domain-containing protein [Anaerolineae bacterium]